MDQLARKGLHFLQYLQHGGVVLWPVERRHYTLYWGRMEDDSSVSIPMTVVCRSTLYMDANAALTWHIFRGQEAPQCACVRACVRDQCQSVEVVSRKTAIVAWYTLYN